MIRKQVSLFCRGQKSAFWKRVHSGEQGAREVRTTRKAVKKLREDFGSQRVQAGQHLRGGEGFEDLVMSRSLP